MSTGAALPSPPEPCPVGCKSERTLFSAALSILGDATVHVELITCSNHRGPIAVWRLVDHQGVFVCWLNDAQALTLIHTYHFYSPVHSVKLP